MLHQQVQTQTKSSPLEILEDLKKNLEISIARGRKAQDEALAQGMSVSANHPADSSYIDISAVAANIDIDEARLDETKRAITKIQEGTYGLCDGVPSVGARKAKPCGKSIPAERLAYTCRPEATRCRPCREEFDRVLPRPTRRRH